MLTGLLVTDDGQGRMKSQWRIVFFISASIYLFGAIAYWLFSSDEPQFWSNPKGVSKDEARHGNDNRVRDEGQNNESPNNYSLDQEENTELPSNNAVEGEERNEPSIFSRIRAYNHT